jgi:hypothetical protein
MTYSVSASTPATFTQDEDTGIVLRGTETVTAFSGLNVDVSGLAWQSKAGQTLLREGTSVGGGTLLQGDVAITSGALLQGDVVVTGIGRSTANDALAVDPATLWQISGPGLPGQESFRLRQAEPGATTWTLTLRRGGR